MKLGRITPAKQPIKITNSKPLKLRARIWKHTETPFYLLVIALGVTTTGMMLYEFGKYLLDPHIETKVFNEASLIIKNSTQAKLVLGEYFQTRLGMVYKSSSQIILEILCKNDGNITKAQVEATADGENYSIKRITLQTEPPVNVYQQPRKGIFGFGYRYK
jgi:hypothetical protein